jgi:integrase
MYVGMGLTKNEHGVWVVRHKVPARLQEAVARVLDNGKERQTWLQKTTGTKDRGEAKRIAVDVLASFHETLGQAEALLSERPLRTSLAQSEIDRIAEFHYASKLEGDDEFTREGGKEEDLVRSIASQLADASVDFTMPVPLDAERPVYGLTTRQVTKRNAELKWYLPIMREALARGDISMVSEAMAELLDRFHLNLDRNNPSYRKLGLAALRAEVRALDDLARRYRGEPVDTPPIVHLEPSVERSTAGDTLREAFVGWNKDRKRSAGVVAEYERACDLFVQLQGNLPVAKITRDHARRFREALQDVPYPRPGKLAKATLPELVEWRRTNPDAPKIKHKSVNKLFGGVQSIVNWARENGMITADMWSDPFHKMQLGEDDPAGGPFEPNELQTLFASPVFTGGEPPRGGQGDVAFWLPMLALFTGARRGELATLQVGDVIKDEATRSWTLAIHADEDAGKKLKTKASARTIPVHPELVRLGFLTLVEAARKRGDDAWLFPPVSPSKPTGAKAWTKWFGGYLGGLGINDSHKALHSLRHNFKDALRAGSVPEDLSDALTGHSVATIGRRYGARARHAKHRHKVIIDRFGMAQLVEAIGKVKYPSIDLQSVCWRAR